jgi:hypothetical protein
LRDDSARETLTRSLPEYKLLEIPYKEALQQAYGSDKKQEKLYQEAGAKLKLDRQGQKV